MKQNAGILFHGETMETNAKSAYDVQGRRKYLSRIEGKKFLEHAVQLPRMEALFCLMIYYTGCRISEALSLRKLDLDSEMNVIMIACLKKRGLKEMRRIPIPSFLVTELQNVNTTEGDDRIWAFSRTTGWRIIKRTMKSAQLTGIHATTKGLRHGFGVRSALSHIPLNLIQAWMGHADVSTTAIYLDIKDEEERELIERTWK